MYLHLSFISLTNTVSPMDLMNIIKRPTLVSLLSSIFVIVLVTL